MREVTLYNKSGQELTTVNVNAEQNEVIEGVQWGGSIFLWNPTLLLFQEATIKPAILNKSK